MHGIAISTEIASDSRMPCIAPTAAPSGSFSPMRRATIAVVAIPSPSPTAMIRVSIDSVSPTVAIASGPSRPTQNISTTANSDSSTISSTIGIASRMIARFRLPVVKSRCDPRSASRTACQRSAAPARFVPSPVANCARFPASNTCEGTAIKLLLSQQTTRPQADRSTPAGKNLLTAARGIGRRWPYPDHKSIRPWYTPGA